MTINLDGRHFRTDIPEGIKHDNYSGSSSLTSTDRKRRPARWPLIWALVKYWGWTITTKALVTIVYLALISQGLKYVLPDIGMKLYKLPGLAFLEFYSATYRLDLSHAFSAIPLVSAWILWYLILEMYLRPDSFARRFRSWDLPRMRRIVLTMGTIIILGDACLFAAAFTLSSWGTARFSVSALLATLVYITVLGFVTFVSLCLSERIKVLQELQEK